MKNEILVISDNFNEFSKYRSLLESSFSVSLRSDLDELRKYLVKKLPTFVIIDIDDPFSDKRLLNITKCLDAYKLDYLIIVESKKDFLESIDDISLFGKDLIMRQSIYQNLYQTTVSKIGLKESQL